jgi:hypothetical protein
LCEDHLSVHAGKVDHAPYFPYCLTKLRDTEPFREAFRGDSVLKPRLGAKTRKTNRVAKMGLKMLDIGYFTPRMTIESIGDG